MKLFSGQSVLGNKVTVDNDKPAIHMLTVKDLPLENNLTKLIELHSDICLYSLFKFSKSLK